MPARSPATPAEPTPAEHADELTTATATDGADLINDVRLRGSLSSEAQTRGLPSGDLLASWRLIVPRGAARPTGPRHDTIDCVTFDPDLIEAATGWAAGDQIEVRGSLRRRFFRAGGSLQSRYDVEARRVRRLAAAPAIADG